jgi:hypothetical protein
MFKDKRPHRVMLRKMVRAFQRGIKSNQTFWPDDVMPSAAHIKEVRSDRVGAIWAMREISQDRKQMKREIFHHHYRPILTLTEG